MYKHKTNPGVTNPVIGSPLLCQFIAFGRIWNGNNGDYIAVIGTACHQLSDGFAHSGVFSACSAFNLFGLNIQSSTVIQMNHDIPYAGFGDKNYTG